MRVGQLGVGNAGRERWGGGGYARLVRGRAGRVGNWAGGKLGRDWAGQIVACGRVAVVVVAVAAGKRPYYKKAREIREEQLTEQFQQLEKSGRLDNYMAKKRKQRASKQRKALPTYSDYTT